ncbi:kelch domain-containing protein [Anaeramoeba ignava]|uniref:Kelch domain-containing protein n=1 Tax=Anaeramoeba ignava TaxID=1746090 RepID=A0A9Q0LFS1_ANAIG|nr:kelch domain-containing protein [Anaeramoeba ignava]
MFQITSCETLPQKGKEPGNTCKSGMLSFPEKGEIMIIGGYCQNRVSNHVKIYKTENNEWDDFPIQTDKENIPISRYGHTVTFYPKKNSVFLFGGYDLHTYLSDFWELNLTTKEWIEYNKNHREDEWPKGRHSHSCVLYEDFLIFFGGRITLEGNRSNEVWSWSIKDQTWNLIKTTGDIPSTRSSHSAAIYKDNMFVFGGVDEDGFTTEFFYQLNLTDFFWTKIHLGTDIYSRASSAFTQIGSRLILIGGRKTLPDFKEDSNNIIVIDLQNFETKLLENSPYFQGRSCHSCIAMDHDIYMFGGEQINLNSCPVIHVNYLEKFSFLHDLVSDLKNFLSNESILMDI